MIVNEDDYYGILGVSYACNDKQIKSAFRKLALQYHPDHNSSTEAEQKFRKICEAYEVLKDPQKRAAYNQFYHKTFKDNDKASEISRKQENRRQDNTEHVIGSIMNVIFIICGIIPIMCYIISFFTWNIPLGIISIGLLIFISIKGYLVNIGAFIFGIILISFIKVIWRSIY